MQRVLIIEDDAALSSGVCMALKQSNLLTEQCFTLQSARDRLQQVSFDLLILDINLPDGSGFEFLQKIREKSQIPIILLTANDMETDVVLGLESGADDYITKPFSLAILRARVHTQLRKQGEGMRLQLDEFMFDFHAMEYQKNAKPIELSKTEQKLLKLLVQNKGITMPRGELVDKIWTDGAVYVDENALSVTIKRLRDKLEDQPTKPRYIKTVYGIGYTWV